MAKGRLIGVQFDALFTDNLYFDISQHAIDMAMRMKDIFKRKGYKFFIDSPTNQQFIILDNEEVKRLSKDFIFTCWGKYDESHRVRRLLCHRYKIRHSAWRGMASRSRMPPTSVRSPVVLRR